MRYTARHGDAWITTGGDAETVDGWLAGLDRAREVLDTALADAGRDPAAYNRYLSLDSSPAFSLESVDRFEDLAGRAAELGFTDVVVHWPRAESPYAGSEAVLEQVASRLPHVGVGLSGFSTASWASQRRLSHWFPGRPGNRVQTRPRAVEDEANPAPLPSPRSRARPS